MKSILGSLGAVTNCNETGTEPLKYFYINNLVTIAYTAAHILDKFATSLIYAYRRPEDRPTDFELPKVQDTKWDNVVTRETKYSHDFKLMIKNAKLDQESYLSHAASLKFSTPYAIWSSLSEFYWYIIPSTLFALIQNLVIFMLCRKYRQLDNKLAAALLQIHRYIPAIKASTSPPMVIGKLYYNKTIQDVLIKPLQETAQLDLSVIERTGKVCLLYTSPSPRD